jgi:hypothetical protein
MTAFNKAVTLGVVRHLLTGAGAYLVATGDLTDGDLDTAVGAIIALIGIVGSYVQKRNVRVTLAAERETSDVLRETLFDERAASALNEEKNR